MKIICASSVLKGQEIFSGVGEVVMLREEEITRAHLMDADALITRTKTRVDRSLLEGTSVRFVGTATAGTDHIDFDAMGELGVHVVSAPGCNAASVADYVTAALLELVHEGHTVLEGRTIGIVGCGQVGRRVATRARALGMKVMANDPPLAASGQEGLSSLHEVLHACDVLSLHVPLVDGGPWPTRTLIGCDALSLLRPGAIVLNACRGEVLDGGALASALDRGHIAQAVLDVWDPEPLLPRPLLDRVFLGSAHIAGHSWEGKFNGTRQVCEALCAWSGRPMPPPDLMAPPESEPITPPLFSVRDAVRAVYDIREDDRLLRAAQNVGEEAARAAAFNTLRRAYRHRREFSAARIQDWRGNPEQTAQLLALGFPRTGALS